VLYGGGILDGNKHDHDDLPVILAGRAGGRLSPGRHVRYEEGTPMANLLLSVLQRMDVEAEKVGDSTGSLDGLADL